MNETTTETETTTDDLPPVEVCANGRLHPGGMMDADWYKYDMDDDEWYGDSGW